MIVMLDDEQLELLAVYDLIQTFHASDTSDFLHNIMLLLFWHNTTWNAP